MRAALYIVPAWSDQAGQCRIVGQLDPDGDACASYRTHPERWMEAGLMNSRGELVCLGKQYGRSAWDELKSCEPLMAGTSFIVEVAEDEFRV